MTLSSIDAAKIPSHLMDIPNEFQALLNNLSGNIADWELESLLRVMNLAFQASKQSIVVLLFPRLKGFDKNLENFSAGYVFGTKDGLVACSANFKDERMDVLTHEIPYWDVKILFKDVRAFWKFLFAGGNDILDSILENDVEVYGNLNYLYKFGYMARDLQQKLKCRVCF